MLVVKPNPRRMQYMRDSPSERPGDLPPPRMVQRVRWDRVAIAVGIAGTVIVGLFELVTHL